MRRDVSMNEGEAVGQDFDSYVACGWSPRILWFSSMQLSGLYMGEGHRLEPEDLGLKWKEGVRMMQSYKICLTLSPLEKRVASLETPGWRKVAGSLRQLLPFFPPYPSLPS